MGARVEWLGEREVKITCQDIDQEKVDFNKISKTRVSVLLIGGLITRFKEFKFSRPGGDRIGLRPITTHLKALEKLGVTVKEEGDFYYLKRENLKGSEIILQEFSPTATENIIIAAVLARGKTIIKGAAGEPSVQNLVSMLKKMGASINILDSHTLEIEGVKELGGCSLDVIPDRIEAGTFIITAALTPGQVLIKNVRPDDLDLFLEKLREIGVIFERQDGSLLVHYSPDLKAAKVQALPYPGFPTDLLPLIVPLLTQAQGKSLVHDPLYENRLNYIHELRKMGADIEIVDPHRAFIFGRTPLKGVKIESWDIRAGASLVIAGLMAGGKTTIGNITHIDRGYEKIEERLQNLGANIKRITVDN
jgi:UDP-N-acetylglucosamine 1-carboxyvinyltransferase